MVRIDTEHPNVSFFPSGFGWLGWVDALCSGVVGLVVLLIWVLILSAFLRRNDW